MSDLKQTPKGLRTPDFDAPAATDAELMQAYRDARTAIEADQGDDPTRHAALLVVTASHLSRRGYQLRGQDWRK